MACYVNQHSKFLRRKLTEFSTEFGFSWGEGGQQRCGQPDGYDIYTVYQSGRAPVQLDFKGGTDTFGLTRLEPCFVVN